MLVWIVLIISIICYVLNKKINKNNQEIEKIKDILVVMDKSIVSASEQLETQVKINKKIIDVLDILNEDNSGEEWKL